MNFGFATFDRTHLRGLALLAVTFVAGLAAGMAVERVRVRTAMPFPEEDIFMVRAELPPPLELLDLTPAQRRQVESLLERRRLQTEAIMREPMPRLRAITDSLQVELRSVLTTEQQKKFNRLMPPFPPFGVEPVPEGGVPVHAPVRVWERTR